MRPDPQFTNVAVDALARTLAEALDTMAFIAAEPADTPPQAPSDALVADMSYSGAAGGRVRLVASRHFAMTLAGNVLGVDPADPESAGKADDCFKELLNVVVGALMPGLARTSADDFALSLPHCRAFAAAEWPDFVHGPGVRTMAADGQPVTARLDAA